MSRKAKSLFPLLLLLFAVAGVILACGESSAGPTNPTTAPTAAPTATSTKVPPAAPKQWVTVQHFSGDQNTQTPSFAVHDGDRIVWTAQATGEFPVFNMTLESHDSSIFGLVANPSKFPAGETYTVHANGQAYLSINTYGVKYDVQVETQQ